MRLPSPAKINLFLHITGRRDDGYHRLQTLFQFLDYGDTLELAADPGGNISRDDRHRFALPDNDLCVRAALALREQAGQPQLGCRLTLTKRIGPGTGLGAGSSNAATTLLGLNRLWNLNFSTPALLDMAANLGADVPIFVHGAASWAEGIGDRFIPFEPEEHWYAVVMPTPGAATAAVFQSPHLRSSHPAITPQQYRYRSTVNDLEAAAVALVPEIGAALQALGQGGDQPRMSGSGSAVFLPCQTRQAATGALATALAKLNTEAPSGQASRGFTGFVARGVNRSPALAALVAN